MASQENMKQSRREFLTGAAMVGAATVAAGCMSGRPCAGKLLTKSAERLWSREYAKGWALV